MFGNLVDKRGMFIICAYDSWPQSGCSDITVTNNIVGGGAYAGFVVPSHECGESET